MKLGTFLKNALSNKYLEIGKYYTPLINFKTLVLSREFNYSINKSNTTKRSLFLINKKNFSSKSGIKILSSNSDEPSPTETFEPEKIRNIGIIAHIDAGKTTTTERMLLYSGVIDKAGEVHDGNTVTDYLQQERDRGITIRAAAVSLKWKDFQINLIDTPGHIDFTAEVERSLRVMDSAVLLFDASQGVETQTVTVWNQAKKYNLPIIAFINKVDKMGANIALTLYEMNKKLKCNPILITFPIGEEQGLKGIVDLISMNYLTFSGTNGRIINTESVYKSRDCEKSIKTILKLREILLEELSNYNEEILEDLLQGNENKIEIDKIVQTLRECVLNKKILPTLCGSSLKNKGVQLLMDSILAFMPSPLETNKVKINIPQEETKEKEKINAKKDIEKDGDLVKIKENKVIYKDVGRLSNSNQTAMGFIFKVIYDNNLGNLCYFKLYFGELKKGSLIRYTNPHVQGHTEKVIQILRIKADECLQLETIKSGDIGALVGLKHQESGITFIQESGSSENQFMFFDPIHIPDPVFFCSIMSRSTSTSNALQIALQQLSKEDPSLRINKDKETGQTVISGLGELHLEIIKDRIEIDYGIKSTLGKMKVSFRESVRQKANENYVLNKIFNGQDLFFEIEMEVSPLPSNYSNIRRTENDTFSNPNLDKSEIYLKSCNCLLVKEFETTENSSKLFVKENGQEESLKNIKQLKYYHKLELMNFIEDSLNLGVLIGYPLNNIKITVKNGYYSTTRTTSVAMRVCIIEALKSIISKAKPALLEPFMYVETNCANIFSNPIIDEINNRKGNIDSITTELLVSNEELIAAKFHYSYLLEDNKDALIKNKKDADKEIQTTIKAYIPLTEMIGYSAYIRSLSKGEATYFMEFHNYDYASPSLEEKVISGEYFYE